MPAHMPVAMISACMPVRMPIATGWLEAAERKCTSTQSLHRLYLGITDGMSIARVWTYRLGEAVILRADTPIPAQ